MNIIYERKIPQAAAKTTMPLSMTFPADAPLVGVADGSSVVSLPVDGASVVPVAELVVGAAEAESVVEAKTVVALEPATEVEVAV